MDDIEHKTGDPIPGIAEPPQPNGDSDDPPDFNIQAESPPAEESQRREPPPPPTPKRLRPAELQGALEDFFGGIAVAVMFTGDQYCADIMATQAKPLAEAWAELAKKNARVRAIIEMMLQGSAWGQVVTVTAATVIPIAAHHGLYPKGLPMPFTFGVGPPPPPSADVQNAEAEQDNPSGQ